MQFDIEQAVEILGRTPIVVRAMLGGLSKPWVFSNYGDKTFSPFDVVGHLIEGERTDWIVRARIILEHGEARPFEPFDRYAQFAKNRGTSLADLLSTFERLRAANLVAVDELNLSSERLDLRGTHPQLGRVTMRELLAAWVVHDLNHLSQIAKAMAFQYRGQVGPWLEFMSILRPPRSDASPTASEASTTIGTNNG
jgi:hypothetical protein